MKNEAGKPNPCQSHVPLSHLLLLLALLLYGMMVLRTAWVCDDAYITFRTVDNAVNGAGLRWNMGERVQAYTHPLWMLLLIPIYALTDSAYLSLLGLSFVCSFGAVFLLGYVAAATPTAGLAILILGLSRAFVDYSTSGLENPLTHLLLAAALTLFLRAPPSLRNLFWLAFIAALAAVNRMDTILLYAPLIAAALWRVRRIKGLAYVAVGFLPLVLWLGFATLYYGFPYPNTAYAKLNTGIERSEMLGQVVRYWLFSLEHDPITPLIILSGLLLPLITRQYRHLVISASIVLYCLYITWIGGDFMGGRFLAAPLLCAVALYARMPLTFLRWNGLGYAALLVFLGSMATIPTYASGTDYGEDGKNRSRAISASGVADERAYYYRRTGLLRWPRGDEWPYVTPSRRNPPMRPSGIVVERNVGFMGYYGAKQQLHILDEYALADPLLARLPANRPWRIGHYRRKIPEGYEETLAKRENRIRDPDLAAYYEKLAYVVSGPLLEPARLIEIMKFNLGSYEYLLQRYLARAYPQQ